MEIKTTLTFPTDLKEIKVKHVVKYLSLPEDKRKNDFELLMVFVGELAKYVNTKDAKAAAKDIRELIDKPVDFHQRFVWKGVEYGFIPSINDMSFGEYLDIQTLEEDGKLWENGHRILTILFRPVIMTMGTEYKIQKYQQINEELAKDWFENLSADVLVGAVAFFFGLTSGFIEQFSPLYEHEPQDPTSTDLLSSYGLYNWLITCTGDDLTKVGQVLELPVEECMQYLCYKKDQAKQLKINRKRPRPK